MFCIGACISFQSDSPQSRYWNPRKKITQSEYWPKLGQVGVLSSIQSPWWWFSVGSESELWDATLRFHQGGLIVPEMEMLSTDGPQLTAPSGTAWAAERHLTQGCTFPWSPHPMTDSGAGIMGLLILPQWGQLWKPLQFPYCLWGQLRPQFGFSFRPWVHWCPPQRQKSPLG